MYDPDRQNPIVVTPVAEMPPQLREAFWLVPLDLQQFPEVSWVAEYVTPTAQLVAMVFQDPTPRPVARIQECAPEARKTDSSLWAHYALHGRQVALRSGIPYLPTCTSCAEPTLLACRACEQPWCEACVLSQTRCQGCPDPNMTPASFAQMTAEAVVVEVQAADLSRAPEEIIEEEPRAARANRRPRPRRG